MLFIQQKITQLCLILSITGDRTSDGSDLHWMIKLKKKLVGRVSSGEILAGFAVEFLKYMLRTITLGI